MDWYNKEKSKYSLGRNPKEESEETEVKQNHCQKLGELNMSQQRKRRKDFTTDVVTRILLR